MSAIPTAPSPPVAGYSGVTANGAGFTGSAPVAGEANTTPPESNASPPYGAVLYDDAGQAPTTSIYGQLVADDRYLALKTGKPSGPAIIADTRSDQQRLADQAYTEFVTAKMKQYSWFDPREPGAWIFLEATEGAAEVQRMRAMLGLLREISKGRLSPTYNPYYRQLSQPPIGTVRPAGPPPR